VVQIVQEVLKFNTPTPYPLSTEESIMHMRQHVASSSYILLDRAREHPFSYKDKSA